MSESVIQNVESGRKSTPTLGQVLALCRELHIPLPALLLPLGSPLDPGVDGLSNFELDATYFVTDPAIDESLALPPEVVRDRDVVRAVRRAVRCLAEVEAWRNRAESSEQSGDEEGLALAYKATARLTSELLDCANTMHAAGLPAIWLSSLMPDRYLDGV